MIARSNFDAARALLPERPGSLISLVRRVLGRAQPDSLWDDEDPIRSELFSVERLEQHAESLAANQPISTTPTSGLSLVDRLADNERVLLEAYRSLAKAADEGRPITPAAEWLLDNYHLVEQQVREVRTDLPPGYYRQLPKLSSGPLVGYPRVFGVAWAFVAHTDSRFDPEALTRFVRAYQNVQPLSIGELWAVAITLRIVLVENLRRSAVRIMSRRSAREEADAVADRLLGVNDLVADPGGAQALRAGAVLRGLHRPARPAPARSGSRDDAGRRLARGAPGARGHDRRRAGAQGASAPGLDQRHGAQHHHQHAPDLRRRLGEAVRGGEPGRRNPARRQRFRRDGFRHTQPLPHRHRADCPRHRPHGAGDRAPRACTSPRPLPAHATAIAASAIPAIT